MSQLRGRLVPNQPLAEFTWFRVGGPAQLLFMPEDEQDFVVLPWRTCRRRFPSRSSASVPISSSATGGVPGVVIRLGRGFSNGRGRAGRAYPGRRRDAGRESGARGSGRRDCRAGVFFRGIPGAIGGALRMNGGAYGGETKDVLVAARGV